MKIQPEDSVSERELTVSTETLREIFQTDSHFLSSITHIIQVAQKHPF